MKNIFIALFSVVYLSTNAQVSFTTSTNFTVGSSPWSVTSADFNADGIADLATANDGSANVSVLLGTGTGSFGPAVAYGAAYSPKSIISADFNADGKVDLATANFDNSNGVSVLLGTGTGSFGAPAHFGLGTRPYSGVSADFNGDGKADLATGNEGSNNVSVLLGTGTGSFSAPVNYVASTSEYSIACADLNGDSKIDLVVTNANSNNVSVLLGTGTGSFGAVTNFAAGTGPSSVAIADFNGDGKPDLAVTEVSSVLVLPGTGTGSFGAATSFTAGSNPRGVTSVDFNGDGKADLAVANSQSDNVSVLLGTGTGSFGAATNFGVGTAPISVISADFNSDGKVDLAVANISSDNVSILLGRLFAGISSTNISCYGGNNGSATVSVSGGPMPYTYLWSNLQTTQSISNLTVGNYSVTATDGTGATATTTVAITQPSILSVSHTLTNSSCLNNSGSANVIVNGGTIPYSYLWSNGSGTQNISGLGAGSYSVSVIDSKGCTISDNLQIANSIAMAPVPICVVTVDSLSQYNNIAWDKQPNQPIDSFIIYREISLGNYQQIGAVPYSALSLFEDTVRAKYFPNTGNPNAGTYRYKLAVRDTCGNYSAQSPFHNTIYMTNSSGSFSWAQLYTIEGSSNPVNTYVLLRDDFNNGTWNAINSVSGTQQNVTDPAYAAWSATANWRIVTQWNISCTPTIKNPEINGTTINNSKSNNLRIFVPGSVDDLSLQNSVSIFPNPSTGDFQVLSSAFQLEGLEVFDLCGSKVHSDSGYSPSYHCVLTQGIYFAHIKTEMGLVVKKIVVVE